MNTIVILINLISGAVGGNVAGTLFKNINLGTLWNSVAGILGGGLGATIMQMIGLTPVGGGIDLKSILASIASGGVGGGVLLAIFAYIKQAMGKK